MTVALLALFVALGGTAAAAKVLITSSKQIKAGTVQRSDLARNAVDTTRVANGSLTVDDFSEATKGSIQAASTSALEAFRAAGPDNVKDKNSAVVATLRNIPPGVYAIFTKTVLTAKNNSQVFPPNNGESLGGHCELDVGGDGDEFPRAARRPRRQLAGQRRQPDHAPLRQHGGGEADLRRDGRRLERVEHVDHRAARRIVPAPGRQRPLKRARNEAPEQHGEVGHPGNEVADRSGDHPGRETLGKRHVCRTLSSARMATAGVSTSVTELPESRVRVEAEVAPEEIEKRIAQSAKTLGRQLRVPGFRPGKIPAPIVIQRVGRAAVLDETVRDHLPAWYSSAIDDARIAPIGEPDLDLGELPEEGKPLTFSIEIGVRPTATLGEYKGLEVPKADGTVTDEAIDAEIESLRERAGRLDTVDRAAEKGDFVVMDFVGSIDGVPFEGGEARDQMLELGSGRLIPGFEEQLEGSAAGEAVTVSLTFPDDYGATDLAGKAAEFAVDVKEIKAKTLPELDEDFAIEQGFDTIDEVREDIRTNLAAQHEEQAQGAFREAALQAAVDNATVEVPDALIEARAQELWNNMIHSLSHQGITQEIYLQISGKTEEEILEEGKPDAENALRREAVLSAIVEAEKLDPDDAALLEALEPDAERSSTSAKKLLERIKSSGRLDDLKQDVAQSQAIDLLVDSAKPVPLPAGEPDATPKES